MTRIFQSNAWIATTLAAAAIAVLPPLAHMAQAKRLRHKHPVPAAETVQAAPLPANPNWGNAAMGGNSANSASGSNSAGENAQGRTGGGFGG